jgi:hypothetical protein
VDLDELMEELHRLEGTHVGISSGGAALYITGTLRVAQAEKRALPTDTFILTDELLESLPAEPTDDLKGFHVGNASVMIIPKWFVSAERTTQGIEIELEHESLSITIFQEGPPYEPQIIDLG